MSLDALGSYIRQFGFKGAEAELMNKSIKEDNPILKIFFNDCLVRLPGYSKENIKKLDPTYIGYDNESY